MYYAHGRRGSAPLLRPEDLLGGLRGGAERPEELWGNFRGGPERPDHRYLSTRRGSAPSQPIHHG